MARVHTAATVVTHSEDETRRLGQTVGRRLRVGDVVALEGGLGTGKTVLARGIAAGLDARGYVASPTFTLIREYRGPIPVCHVDLYRLHPREVDDLALEELMARGVMVIEWAETAAHLLRPPLLRTRIVEGPGPEDRVVHLEGEGEGPESAVRAAEHHGAHDRPGD